MKTLFVLLVMFVAAGLAPAANANPYVLTLEEVGGDVVANGSGSIDTDGLTPSNTLSYGPLVQPNVGAIVTGTTTSASEIEYDFDASVGLDFGSGGETNATSGSGLNVGFCVSCDPSYDELFVPDGYVSDTALTDSATYQNATFANLGVTPGSYTWSWGSDPDQSFTLDIERPNSAGAPGPIAGAGLPGLVFAGGGILVAMWRRKRRAQAIAA